MNKQLAEKKAAALSSLRVLALKLIVATIILVVAKAMYVAITILFNL